MGHKLNMGKNAGSDVTLFDSIARNENQFPYSIQRYYNVKSG